MRVLLTRVATGIAAVAVSAGFVAATTAPAEAAGCTTSFPTYTTVGSGATGTRARAVECLLHQGGFTTTQDSSFSVADTKALKAFQTRHRLSATGRTSGATWAALIAQGRTPTLRPGSTGTDVRRLQLSLRALGHDELPGTTFYGDKTAAAVKSLQKRIGLAATGRAGAKEWAALQAGGQGAAKPVSGSSGSGGGTAPSTSRGATALAFAKKQLGDRYKYAAAGPDAWDCSGLTLKAWAAAGVTLPHSAAAQYRLGTKVAKADLRPGDLVFFYSGPSHVGIYAGDGQVIHAPKPGSKVGYIKIAYMPWKGARRPG